MTVLERMRTTAPTLMWLAVLLAFVLAAAPAVRAADYDQDVDVSTFYDELDGDGDWVEHPQHGYVWTPAVDDEWRPYTRGHWIDTEEHGWYWESDEPFGWAVYHYGRWGYDEEIGWFWVPGSKWGPAWVDWRHSDDEIGWRPLGPEEIWEPSGGVRIRATYYDEPRYAPRWIFVSPRHFAEPILSVHIFPRYRSVEFLPRTRRVTTYTVVDRRIVNRGLTISFVQRYAARPVVTRRITVTDTRVVRRPGTTTTVVNVYRPKSLRVTNTTRTVRLTKPRTVVNRTVVVEKKQTVRRQQENLRAGRQDLREDRRELNQDKREAKQDLRQDKRELKDDRREVNQELRQGKRDLNQELRQGKRELNQEKREDQRELNQEKRALQQQQRQVNQQQKALEKQQRQLERKASRNDGPGGGGAKNRGPNAGGGGGGGAKAAQNQGQDKPRKGGPGGGQGGNAEQQKKKKNQQNQL